MSSERSILKGHMDRLEFSIEKEVDVFEELSIILSLLKSSSSKDLVEFGDLGLGKILAKMTTSKLAVDKSFCELLLTLMTYLAGYKEDTTEVIFCNENISQLGSSGVCEFAVWCLQKYIRDDNLITCCCRCIRALSYNSSINQQNFFSRGACELIVGVLVSCEENEEICENACWALMSLVFDDDMAVAAGSLGIPEILVKILYRHVETEKGDRMKCAALWTLRNLCASSSENMNRFRNAGIVLAMIKMMESNRLNELTIITAYLAAMAGLCFDDEFAKTFGATGKIHDLMSLLDPMVVNESVAYLASELIRNLSACADAKSNVDMLMAAGASELLVHVLSHFEDYMDIAVMAARALGNLAMVEAYRSKLFEVGAVNVMHAVTGRGSRGPASSSASASATNTPVEDPSVTPVPALRRRASVMGVLLGDPSSVDLDSSAAELDLARRNLHILMGVKVSADEDKSQDSSRTSSGQSSRRPSLGDIGEYASSEDGDTVNLLSARSDEDLDAIRISSHSRGGLRKKPAAKARVPGVTVRKRSSPTKFFSASQVAVLNSLHSKHSGASSRPATGASSGSAASSAAAMAFSGGDAKSPTRKFKSQSVSPELKGDIVAAVETPVAVVSQTKADGFSLSGQVQRLSRKSMTRMGTWHSSGSAAGSPGNSAGSSGFGLLGPAKSTLAVGGGRLYPVFKPSPSPSQPTSNRRQSMGGSQNQKPLETDSSGTANSNKDAS